MGIIRFLLAISVVIAHTSALRGFNMVGGELAVKLFFIISGFYMGLVLNEKYIGESGSYKIFIKNRLLRIYPLYVLILILTLIICTVALSIKPDMLTALSQFKTYSAAFTSPTWFYLLFSNIGLIGMDSSLFLALNPETGVLEFSQNFELSNPKVYSFLFVPQAWSVSLELMFYLLAPFICRNLKTIIVLALISFSLGIVLRHIGLPDDPWNYRFFPTQFFYFMLGSACYFFYKNLQTNQFKYLSWVFYMLVITLIIFYSQFSEISNKKMLDWVLIILLASGVPLIFNLSKKWKADRFIGELSYSIYLIHFFVIYCVKVSGYSRISFLGFNEIVLLLTILLSVVLQKFFVERLEKFRILN